jgi:hypothetical protein
VRGGVRPFRGSGADARRYVESDRSTADDYYLSTDAVFAAWTLTDATGATVAAAELEPEAYADWVDWTHPVTGESMGTPRVASADRTHRVHTLPARLQSKSQLTATGIPLAPHFGISAE